MNVMESNPFANHRYHTFLQTLRFVRKVRTAQTRRSFQKGSAVIEFFSFTGCMSFSYSLRGLSFHKSNIGGLTTGEGTGDLLLLVD